MLKLGVCRPEYFFASPPDRPWLYVYYRLSRSRVSFRLLHYSGREAESTTFFERLMRHIRLSNGVCRTTFERRFRNLDTVVNGILSQHFSARDYLLIEDWAASACLTSCQWAESLLDIFPQMRFVASDLVLSVLEIENRDSKEVFIAEEDGTPLQYVRPPFVIRLTPPEPWPLLINRFWYSWAKFRWQNVRRIWTRAEALLYQDENGIQQKDCEGYRIRKLSVVHPRALALARSDGRFAIRRHSVFDRANAPCHVIRTMNILNRAYFNEQQIAQAARSIVASLIPGGIWILGRTVSDDPPVHNVSIFQRRRSGELELIEQIGEGSEVASIALSATEPTILAS